MTNTVGAVADTAGVIDVIGGFQYRVELLNRVDDGDVFFKSASKALL